MAVFLPNNYHYVKQIHNYIDMKFKAGYEVSKDTPEHDNRDKGLRIAMTQLVMTLPIEYLTRLFKPFIEDSEHTVKYTVQIDIPDEPRELNPVSFAQRLQQAMELKNKP